MIELRKGSAFSFGFIRQVTGTGKEGEGLMLGLDYSTSDRHHIGVLHYLAPGNKTLLQFICIIVMIGTIHFVILYILIRTEHFQ